jgi:hypothetical protein
MKKVERKGLTFILVLMFCMIPTSVRADEWTVGSWNIWHFGAHNVSFAIGWNETDGALLFKLYEEPDRPHNKGLALVEAIVPHNKTIDHISAYKQLPDGILLNMLKNYSIFSITFDRGTGIEEDAWYANAYVYLWENHSIVDESAAYFNTYRIYIPGVSTTINQSVFTTLSSAPSKVSLAQDTFPSAICKVFEDTTTSTTTVASSSTIDPTSTSTIPNEVDFSLLLIVGVGFFILICTLVIFKYNR